MLIQVGKKGIAFTSIPIRTNPKTRESRLFKSVFRFIERSATTLLRMYSMYQPLRVFTALGFIVALIGLVPMLRFLYDYFFVSGTGKIQSLVIGSALLTIGVLSFLLGLVADLVNHNRALIEILLEKTRRAELNDLRHLHEGSSGPDLPERLERSRQVSASEPANLVDVSAFNNQS